MDVILALLRDTVTIGTVPRRCALIPDLRRSASTVRTEDGEKTAYSLEAVFRVGAAPPVGSTITTKTGVVARVVSVVVLDQPGPWMRHARVYAATRADLIGGPTPDVMTVVPSTVTVDEYRTRVRVPDEGAAFDVAGRLEPVQSGESTADGQRSYRTWTLVVDADLAALGVDAWSMIIGPDGAEYALDGDPVVRRDVTGSSWSTAILRSWGTQPVPSS